MFILAPLTKPISVIPYPNANLIPDSTAADKDATIGIFALTAFNTQSPVNLPVEVKKIPLKL